MRRTEWLELAGLLLMAAAGGLLIYGLSLWSTAAAFVVGGLLLGTVGLVSLGYAMRAGGKA